MLSFLSLFFQLLSLVIALYATYLFYTQVNELRDNLEIDPEYKSTAEYKNLLNDGSSNLLIGIFAWLVTISIFFS